MGLLTSLLPMAASFIPGAGPFLGPALSAGMNIAQGGGILNSLASAGMQFGLSKLPGMLNQGGQAANMASSMAPQVAGQFSGTANDILTDLAEKNLRRLSGSFSGNMMGGL